MQSTRLSYNNEGFTLLEVLFAIMIVTVALVGLLKSVELATEQNLKNQMRDEAVLVAETEINHMRAIPFTMISTATSPATYSYAKRLVHSKLRGVNKSYTVVRKTIASSDGSAIDVGVRVAWTYKNVSTAHEVHTVRGK